METIARLIIAFLLLTVYVMMKHVLALLDAQENEPSSALDLDMDERNVVVVYWYWLDVVVAALLIGLVLITPPVAPGPFL